MEAAEYWVKKLNLEKHPEGGYFKEVYRSGELLSSNALPFRYKSDRCFATSIYFLLKRMEFSSFHRIQSDETWHFYVGSTLELYVLGEDGTLTTILLGRNFDKGENLQITIPRNHWFAARVIDPDHFALLGCTVAPGFHFEDFELANRKSLIQEFPQHKNIIRSFTFK